MSWPFVSLGCVCFFVFDITIMLCLLEGSLTFGLCQSAIWKCVLSQTKLLEEVIVCSVTGDIAPVVSQSGTQGNNLSFSSIKIKINSPPPSFFLSFFFFFLFCIVKSSPPPPPFFFHTINPFTEKLHGLSCHLRPNVIYFDLARGVSTTLTPNLQCGGQVISSEPTKHRAGEENDKKLIEQTNYVKWPGVAHTLYQFTLQQTCFLLKLCWALTQLAFW